MKKKPEATVREPTDPGSIDDEMRPEYDFSSGVRGKYAKRVAEGTNLIVLDPDLAAQFPDSKSVSRALRHYLEMRSKPH